ncbi:MAG TPA: 3-deoxy-7-phosphoheptulonate synthase [Coxiellaceae bacterium]|nr:3-deoxy-7-phosphoheptulonate synthase [Coxiellaceae bacterium]
MQNWSPNSWQHYSNAQPINYEVNSELQAVLVSLGKASPLVEIAQIESLRKLLGDVAKQKAFILQAGECAERFVDAQPQRVQAQATLLNELSDLLAQQLKKPMITIGRIAGQYAKPRTLAFETRDGMELPNYRGDLINALEFNAAARRANPERLLMAYESAKQALNLLASCAPQLYTSHEVLHLPFEQSLTRRVADNYYNTATHFPWVGVRTAYFDSAHIEYVSGLINPVAVKLGNQCDAAALQALIYKLNPRAELGRLSLIHRLGTTEIAKTLPKLIKAAQETAIPVLWICDPMHGNTQHKANRKLRILSAMRDELQQALQIHHDLGSHLSGLHLELTSDAVNECVADLEAPFVGNPSYVVDPRLNRTQAQELLGGLSSSYLQAINK